MINIPSDQPTLQAGVDVATDGDTILVAPGIYSGPGNQDVVIDSKSLYLFSSHGRDSTVFILEPQAVGIHIDYPWESELPADTVYVDGFTFRDGAVAISLVQEFADTRGATRVSRCLFRNNAVALEEHPAFDKASAPRFEIRLDEDIRLAIDSTIFDSNGIGLSLRGESDYFIGASVSTCTFTANDTAYYAPLGFNLNCRIAECLFENNDRALHGDFDLLDSELKNNRVAIYGMMDYVSTYHDNSLTDCLIQGTSDTVFHVGAVTDITDCQIIDNNGIMATTYPFTSEGGSTLRIYGCTISGNHGQIESRGDLIIQNSVYSINTEGIMITPNPVGFRIENTLFHDNLGDCLIFDPLPSKSSEKSENLLIRNATFVSNLGSAVRNESGPSPAIEIENCIIANNQGYGLYIDNSNSTPPPVLSCSDIFNNALGNYAGFDDQTGLDGNISADPLFCDTASGDFSLSNLSSCAPGHNSCGVLMGALGITCLTPFIYEIKVDTLGDSLHVLSEAPLLQWRYDLVAGLQTEFEIAVGTDNDWTEAEMWAPESFVSPDTFMVYAGATLFDGQTYYLRLRYFSGQDWSDWKEISFRMNSTPTTPLPSTPPDSAVVDLAQPTFWWLNAVDDDHDTLTYGIEIYIDTLQSPTYSTADIVETSDSTAWIPETALTDNQNYFWRIRAADSFENSTWSAFRLCTVNFEPNAPLDFLAVCPPFDSAEVIYEMLPEFCWTTAIDTDPSDSVLYTLILAMEPDFIFTLEIDSLPDTSFALSDSLQFGHEYWWKIRATDKTGLFTYSSNVRSFKTWYLGDVNGDWRFDVLDIIFVTDYKFRGGPPPIPLFTADSNGDCRVNILDIIRMVDYKFKGGPPILPGCEE